MVITWGPVIRGDTPHFDVVVAEASKGIASVARDTSVPVIFGVLTTETMQQAMVQVLVQGHIEDQSVLGVGLGCFFAILGRGLAKWPLLSSN